MGRWGLGGKSRFAILLLSIYPHRTKINLLAPRIVSVIRPHSSAEAKGKHENTIFASKNHFSSALEHIHTFCELIFLSSPSSPSINTINLKGEQRGEAERSEIFHRFRAAFMTFSCFMCTNRAEWSFVIVDGETRKDEIRDFVVVFFSIDEFKASQRLTGTSRIYGSSCAFRSFRWAFKAFCVHFKPFFRQENSLRDKDEVMRKLPNKTFHLLSRP